METSTIEKLAEDKNFKTSITQIRFEKAKQALETMAVIMPDNSEIIISIKDCKASEMMDISKALNVPLNKPFEMPALDHYWIRIKTNFGYINIDSIKYKKIESSEFVEA